MPGEWFRKRHYPHFDVPVSKTFALLAERPSFVKAHPFSPLISYEKVSRRYDADTKRIKIKSRPIMYASHRDACILSYYSYILSQKLEDIYRLDNTSENVVAYRSLGKSNYHFSADALQFALANQPCTVLAFDVTKFFDTLNHSLLKRRLKAALGVDELSADWFAVFRYATKFRHVALSDLSQHPVFGDRLKKKERAPIATLSELKAAKVPIALNPNTYGIPQGTPISSTLANLYMREFDISISRYVAGIEGFYRRYSDDILIICSENHRAEVVHRIEAAMATECLTISAGKTEITQFSPGQHKSAQYLGFQLHPEGASLRPGSLSRQWRKMRKAVKRAQKAGEEAIAAGKSTKIYTKRIRRRFTKLPVRNFSSYARRSAAELGSKQVLRQVRRLEKKFDELVRGLS